MLAAERPSEPVYTTISRVKAADYAALLSSVPPKVLTLLLRKTKGLPSTAQARLMAVPEATGGRPSRALGPTRPPPACPGCPAIPAVRPIPVVMAVRHPAQVVLPAPSLGAEPPKETPLPVQAPTHGPLGAPALPAHTDTGPRALALLLARVLAIKATPPVPAIIIATASIAMAAWVLN